MTEICLQKEKMIKFEMYVCPWTQIHVSVYQRKINHKQIYTQSKELILSLLK